MQVRILTARPGYPSGAIVEMDEAQARAWIGSGMAEPVQPVSRQVPVETTMADPDGETAVTHARRGRGRR